MLVMTMSIHDILDKKVPSGSLVNLQGKVGQILPAFALGDLAYERFVLEDDTGKLTVIAPSSPRYILPGDKIKVEGRVRPCPYALSVSCLETTFDDIKILEWKWIDPRFRQEIDKKGEFSVNALLQITEFDNEVLRGVIETDLDPLKMRSKLEENASSGKGISYLVDTLAAMTMYSIFLRDLNAAKTVKEVLYMSESINVPKEEKRVLEVLGRMVDSLVSREGLAPYVQPPETTKGIVERYPIASKDEVSTLPHLASLANDLLNEVKGGKKEFILIEVASNDQLAEARRLAEIVAGATGAKLYYMSYSSISSTRGIADVLSDLKTIPSGLEGGKVVFYLEGLEMLVPSERALEMMKVPPEGVQGMKVLKAEVLKAMEEILGKAWVIAATTSKMMLDENLVEKASKVVSGSAGASISSESQGYTM